MSERMEPPPEPVGRPPSPLDSYVGNRIRRAREQRATSPEALGQAVGASRALIESYEAGAVKINPSMLYSIATTLGVTLGSLFGLENG